MTNNYQHIKRSYRSEDIAQTYDTKRFRLSPRKQLLNRLFLNALTGIINVIKSNGMSDPPGHPVGEPPRNNRDSTHAPRILDIPCGTGRTFKTLVNKGIDLIGADISMEMMKVSDLPLRDFHHMGIPLGMEKIGLVQCDAERMPFKNKSFDVILCLRFLTLRVPAEARKMIFREMKRVSRKWVIIECRQRNFWSNIWYWWAETFQNNPRFNYFTRDEIKKELEKAGIDLVRTFTPFGMFSNKWLLLGRVYPDEGRVKDTK